MNIYKVWTHARGDETVEAAEFTITNEEGLVFFDPKGARIAVYSSGSWVSVQISKES